MNKTIAIACSLLYLGGPSAWGVSLQWTRQLVTSSSDWISGVSADGLGNVYISGYTPGSLGGTNAGGNDTFVAKYDASGTLQWTRQFGTSKDDNGGSVSADGLGNVYISGTISLGGTNAGLEYAFVTKYDAAGNLQWTRQLGTSSTDLGGGVSADGLGNVYISGATRGSLGGTNAGGYDAFVAKYNASGTLQWTRQFGTSSNDLGGGVSADGLGNVYLSGGTNGSLGGPNAGGQDVFVAKYNADGSGQWTRQLGTSSDESGGVSADGLGNIYVSGTTPGSLGGPNAGLDDAFVGKYDAAGNLQWTRQLGTSTSDAGFGLSADGLGNIYITGDTFGNLDGTSAGSGDAFVSKYDAAGNLQWTRQLGTKMFDRSNAASADRLGNVYISGVTQGSLGGTNAGGGYDAFVAKYNDPIPGDYNGNGIVDAADYTVWRDSLGSTTNLAADGNGNNQIDARDYDFWKSHVGTPVPAPAGDYNHDGIVDAADYTVWRDSLGSTTNLAADGNGNNQIDAGDYDFWKSHVGTPVPAPAGDYNLDGIVDAADYTVWRDSLGSTINLAADGNGNGVIDAGDYDFWKSHFGNHAGSGAGAGAAVPEPPSLRLSIVAMAGMALFCHRL